MGCVQSFRDNCKKVIAILNSEEEIDPRRCSAMVVDRSYDRTKERQCYKNKMTNFSYCHLHMKALKKRVFNHTDMPTDLIHMVFEY